MPGIFETFGKYRLTERLAFGGMAEVFLATIHGAAGFVKPVVIKRLHPRLSEDSDFVQMLIDEARITAQLIHGNICQVLDLGAVDSSYYIAMEFVSGEDLRTLQDACGRRRIELPAEAAIYIVSEVLAGLDYAHRKEGQDGRTLGIVHRDISPQNVLLSYEGEVKIIDFGIAKARQRLVQTQAGVIKGKFRYMSPEQASGDPIDHRTDIFAAGVVLYELLRGSPHSLDLSDTEVLRRMRRAEFDPLTRIRPSVPPELDALVRKALARRARDRYGSAAEFRQVLLQFLVSRGVSYGRTELATLMRSYFDEERRRKRSGSVVSAASELASTGATGPEPRRDPTDVLDDADLLEYSSEPGARSEKWVAFAATTESTPHALAQRERSGSASIRERSGSSAVELSAADAFEVESLEDPPALPDTEQTRAFDPERRPASSVAARRTPSQSRRGPVPPRYEDADASVPTAAMSRPDFSDPQIGEDATRERSAPLPPTNELPHRPTELRDPPADLHRQPTGAPDRVRRPVDDRRTLPERDEDLRTLREHDEDRRTLAERDDRPAGGTGFFSQRAETRIGEAAPAGPIPRQRATTLRTAIGVGIVAVLGSGLALALFLLDRPLPVPPPLPGSSGSSLAQMLHGDGGARPLEARAPTLSPTARLGVVRVVSKPAGAKVVMCGVPIEMRTPAVAQAEIGAPCTVELQLDGYQTYRTEITPRPGSPLLIVATLRRGGGTGGGGGGPRPVRGGGTLRVTSIQVGTVYVEGKVVGRTPMLAVPLAAGEYNVKMHFPTLDVMTRTRRVTIQAGKTSSLHFDATP